MKVLAIDPGIAYIGLCLLDAEGQWLKAETIRLGQKMDPEERIEKLREELLNFLKDISQYDVTRSELHVVIEGFAMYGLKGSVVNAFHMGRVVQCIIDILASGSITIAGVVPARSVRKYITGNPSAKSTQIKAGLKLMGYEGGNDHTRDALALALYWKEHRGD